MVFRARTDESDDGERFGPLKEGVFENVDTIAG